MKRLTPAERTQVVHDTYRELRVRLITRFGAKNLKPVFKQLRQFILAQEKVGHEVAPE